MFKGIWYMWIKLDLQYSNEPWVSSSENHDWSKDIYHNEVTRHFSNCGYPTMCFPNFLCGDWWCGFTWASYARWWPGPEPRWRTQTLRWSSRCSCLEHARDTTDYNRNNLMGVLVLLLSWEMWQLHTCTSISVSTKSKELLLHLGRRCDAA